MRQRGWMLTRDRDPLCESASVPHDTHIVREVCSLHLAHFSGSHSVATLVGANRFHGSEFELSRNKNPKLLG